MPTIWPGANPDELPAVEAFAQEVVGTAAAAATCIGKPRFPHPGKRASFGDWLGCRFIAQNSIAGALILKELAAVGTIPTPTKN